MADERGEHRQAWELIPWVVNGRATAEECEQVERHLAQCADCRAELAFERGLADALQPAAAPATIDGEQAFARLWQRIGSPAATAERRRGYGALVAMLAVTVLVESVALVGQGAALWLRPAYRTLASAEALPRDASLRVVVVPATSVADFHALLDGARVRIVAGPSAQDAYALATLDSGASAQARALERLRASPAVRFAEPIAP